MEEKQFLISINRLLHEKYGVSLTDSGFSEKEWIKRFGDESAENAVDRYAENFDLISRDNALLW